MFRSFAASIRERMIGNQSQSEGSPPEIVQQETADAAELLNEDTLREEDDDNIEQTNNDTAKEKQEEEEEDIIVGGEIDTPAFCVLAGILETDEGNTRITLPITRLPATLGRTHNTKETNFVPMGTVKALSRQQCRIEYRVGVDGQLQQTQKSKDDFRYKPETTSGQPILNPTKAKMPDTGFYTVTCLGKTRMVVDGARLEQGQTCVLKSESALRISSYSLYFLLPALPSKKTMLVPVASKKRKHAAAAAAGADTGSPPNKRGRGFAKTWQNLQKEFDGLTTEQLKDQMTAAIEEGIWERRHQLLGATISFRAVQAAMQSSVLRAAADAKGGVSRIEVMEWIAESPEFDVWVEEMLEKMEAKSYQASITKAMVKAGLERTASSGRYIKWLFPHQVRAIKAEKDDEAAVNEPKSAADGKKNVPGQSRPEHNAASPVNKDADRSSAKSEDESSVAEESAPSDTGAEVEGPDRDVKG